MSATLWIYNVILAPGASEIDPAHPPAVLFLWPRRDNDCFADIHLTSSLNGLCMISVSMRLIEPRPPRLYTKYGYSPLLPGDAPADGHPTQWTGLLQIQPGDVGQDYQVTICLPDFDHGDFGSMAYFTQVTLRRL
jgi:hypothetical protein